MEIPRNKNSSKDQQTSKSSNKQQKNRSNLFSTSNTSIPNIQSKKRKVTTTFNGVLLEIAKPSLKPKDPGVSAPQKLPPNATTNSFQLSVPNISSQTEIKDDLPPGPVENELLPFIPTEQKLTDNSVLPSRTPTSFKSYLQSRYRKLKDQKPRELSKLFNGIVVYINGFTGKINDLEVKRLIKAHGGEVSYTFSTIKCTHVVTAMPLNGSKNHQYLTAKTSRIKIVTPEWVSQSVEAGKRLNEARFRVVQDETQKSVVEFMFNKSQSAARNI